MADTIDPRDLYSGVDYNIMQWILSERLAFKATPAFAHTADDVIDEAVLRSYSWPMTIHGSKVTEEKFREYSSYLIANNLNTEGKIDADFEQSRRRATEAYRDVPNNLLHAKAAYKRARSAKNAANARIFGWNVARVMVPVATLAAIGGGLTAVGSLLTSSAFATMLGGTVGVGLFGLAAVGTVGYIGYKLVKSAIKWLSSKSKAKKARAIEDKRARLQELESAEEAYKNAKDMKKQRDNTRNKNNLYTPPLLRRENQRIITTDRNRITQIRSELEALKTGTFDPLKARESSIDSMDMTAAATFVADANNLLSTGTPSNITTLENELTTIQNRLTNLDKCAGQAEQVTEITTAIAGIRSALVAPMKTEAEALRVKAQERYDSLAAGFTGAARTVNSEVSRIRTKFEKMKQYEEARQTSLSVVATTNVVTTLEAIERNPANADRYAETELYDMLTELDGLDLSKLSSADSTAIQTDITNLKNDIEAMQRSNIIRNNTIIKAANSARIKILRKEAAVENALNSVEGKISRLKTLSTGKDVSSESVASLTDDELKKLIKLESKVNAIDVTAAERKISELQAEIRANEDALRADIYSGVTFDFNMADVNNEYLEICKADIETLKNKIQEAKEEQARRANEIGLENVVTAAENAFATISSTLTTFESLLAETDATLRAKSLEDLKTYIANIDEQNATISAVNWGDLQTRINDALTAVGGTVDAALQARINAVTTNITKATTALSNYAGKKASAQTIKTAKENEIATVRNLENRKPDLVARFDAVMDGISRDLPSMAEHISDSDKILSDRIDFGATLRSIHENKRNASSLYNGLQSLINDITNALSDAVTESSNVDKLNRLKAELQTKQEDVENAITQLNTYESLVVAAARERGDRGGDGVEVTPMTEDEFRNIVEETYVTLDRFTQILEDAGITTSAAHTGIASLRDYLSKVQYTDKSVKGKTKEKFNALLHKGAKNKNLAFTGLTKIQQDVETLLSHHRGMSH